MTAIMNDRSQIKVHTDERIQVHSARSTMQAVTHPSTTLRNVFELLLFLVHNKIKLINVIVLCIWGFCKNSFTWL